MSFQCSQLEDVGANFWPLWQQHQDYLYRCCCKWMGNPTDAEDALSRAMLKAWEKVRDCTVVIKNFKAWLTKLTYNLCADIHRENDRSAVAVDSLDTIATDNATELISQQETPIISATNREVELFFREAIDELPGRLRETFLLYFESELSYQEIAEQLGILYDNVRKRISQARSILRQRFNENFGEDATDSGLSEPKSRVSRRHAKPKQSQQTDRDEPVAGDIALSGKLEPAQIFGGGELPEAALSAIQVEPVLLDDLSDEKSEEIEIVVGREPQSPALSVPHKETLELKERMNVEKPTFLSCSSEILDFLSSSQRMILLEAIASRSTLKQLLIGVFLARRSDFSTPPMPETKLIRLLTQKASSAHQKIDSS
ncbi:MAG: sigma-70 family RNA polymerase sigma factor [Oscillatoriaceae cyanobacterium Prado104]|nr:sigma-70 family RNA polymerase sigma factor [Oscillatoriaceae cyanobacterium Prado104]